MTASSLKTALRELCREAVEVAEDPRTYQNASALANTRRKEAFAQLSTFAVAVAVAGDDPRVIEQFGMPYVETVVVQFVIEFLGSLDQLQFDAHVFERTWNVFQRELSEADRRYAIATNLQNFNCADDVVSLTDGVTIRSRSYDALANQLLWSREMIDHTLGRDWAAIGGGSHVLLAETRQKKAPENVVLENDAACEEKLRRTLLALRLFKSGFLRTGVLFYAKPEYFSISLRGIASAGNAASWQPGSQYSLTAAEAAAVNELYELVARVEKRQDRHVRPINIALRSFNSLYAREHFRPDDRLVNAVTALEALLRIDAELSFKSAFRVAGILASSDDERVSMYEAMRSYYDTRSTIVHGGELKAKHRSDLRNEEPLIEWTRQLLRGFLRLADHQRINDEFYGSLDSTLQHQERRTKLRADMGLA